jgi:hypothetical protein
LRKRETQSQSQQSGLLARHKVAFVSTCFSKQPSALLIAPDYETPTSAFAAFDVSVREIFNGTVRHASFVKSSSERVKEILEIIMLHGTYMIWRTTVSSSLLLNAFVTQ